MQLWEEDLVKRAINGDQPALLSLLEKHGPVIRSRIAGEIPERWRSLLSEDDVMQQTYADALRDIGKFVPRASGSLPGWLTTLARRNLLDAIRSLEAAKRGGGRLRNEPHTADGSFLRLYEELVGTSTTPSREAARHEASDRLKRAIRKLPQTYRRVVEMYDIEGREIHEVAGALGRSAGAVFMLRARAHARLREEMGPASGFLSGSA